MRSKQLDLTKYNTDKVKNRYLEIYDRIFEPLVDKEIALLEVGIYEGGSLLLWHDYFPKSKVIGIDIKAPSNVSLPQGVYFFKGSQADKAFLSSVIEKVAPEGLDIIIDDASHIGELTKITFWHLFDHHLKPGGIYVIEDWGTGYWDDFVDGKKYKVRQPILSILWRRLLQLNRGRKLIYKFPFKVPIKSHDYGMVGFVKDLIDELGAHDVTRVYSTKSQGRLSKFEYLLFFPTMVFVKKRQ
ncbi:MAG: hypothetical protein Fur0020_00160 [Thermodesulfovibrionia bacterium]